jgi:folate-binding protein YgfZ
VVVQTQALRVARRDRAFVRVAGPDAEDFLQRMLSQDVAIDLGDACEALLLTAKARVIATMVVLRRSSEDFLLSTEASLGERLVRDLRRARFAAKVQIEPERHDVVLVFGTKPGGVAYPVDDYGEPAWEVLDAQFVEPVELVDPAVLEAMRIRARTARIGREIDDRVLPEEAGLTGRAVSFTKGCYPGQEPVARLHYRGHANRGLRVLELETGELPPYDAEVTYDGKPVGRITSAVEAPGGVVALAYVRREVPAGAALTVASATARQVAASEARDHAVDHLH